MHKSRSYNFTQNWLDATHTHTHRAFLFIKTEKLLRAVPVSVYCERSHWCEGNFQLIKMDEQERKTKLE